MEPSAPGCLGELLLQGNLGEIVTSSWNWAGTGREGGESCLSINPAPLPAGLCCRDPVLGSQPVVLCIVYIKCCITDKKRQFAPSPDCAGPSLWMDNEPCSGTALCFCSVANAAPQNPVALAGAVAAGAGSIPSLTNPFCPGGEQSLSLQPHPDKETNQAPCRFGERSCSNAGTTGDAHDLV